jgi:hypothetical protein
VCENTVSRELALEYCHVFMGQAALRDFDSCHRRCRIPTPNAKAMLIFMIPMIALFIVSLIVVAFKS